MVLVAFKAIDPVLSGRDGGFDSHTLPPPPFCFKYLRRAWHHFLGLAPNQFPSTLPANESTARLCASPMTCAYLCSVMRESL